MYILTKKHYHREQKYHLVKVVIYKQSQRKPKVPENFHHYKISSVREKAKLLGVQILRQVPSLYKQIKLKFDEKS